MNKVCTVIFYIVAFSGFSFSQSSECNVSSSTYDLNRLEETMIGTPQYTTAQTTLSVSTVAGRSSTTAPHWSMCGLSPSQQTYGKWFKLNNIDQCDRICFSPVTMTYPFSGITIRGLIFQGTDCNNLTVAGCIGVLQIFGGLLSNFEYTPDVELNPNLDIWIYFFAASNLSNNNVEFKVFGVKNQGNFCTNTDLVMNNIGGDEGEWLPPTLASISCLGGNWTSNENTVYYEFRPSSLGGGINIENIICNEGVDGLAQLAIFKNCDCIGQYTPECFFGCTVGDGNISFTNLDINETYVLVVDGFSGSYCKWNVNIQQGYLIPTCQPSNFNMDIESCDSYLWEVNNTTYTESGVYQFVSQNIYGCDSIYTLNLTIRQTVQPSLIINSGIANNSICEGSSVTFSVVQENEGSAPIYDWKINGATVSSSQNFSSSSLQDNDVVSCEMISSETCITNPNAQSNEIVISVLPVLNPSVSITADDTDLTICDGNTLTFFSDRFDEGSSPSYVWKVNGIAVGTSASFSSAALANNDVVTFELTNSDGCVSTAVATSNSLNITVNPNLTPAISITSPEMDNSFCEGSVITFSSNPLNQGPTPIYQWKINGASIPGETSSSFSSTSINDQDIVTCELTSSETCVTSPTALSSAIVITVISLVTPSVTITTNNSDLTICDGNMLTFSSNRIDEGSSPSYVWKVNGIAVGTSASFSSATLVNSDVITFELTNSDECVSTAVATSNSLNITVNPNLTPNLSITSGDVDNSICSGNSVNFTSLAINGGLNPTYTWKINGTAISSGPSFSTASLQNNDVVSCELLSSEICLTQVSVTSNSFVFNVNSLPAITIGTINNTSSCGNTDGSIDINGTGSGTISWSGTSIGSQAVTLPYTLSNLIAGAYNLMFDDGCPSNIVSASISDPNLPNTPTITSDAPLTFCEGSSVTLTSSASNSIMWSTGETSQSITVTTSGDYYVTQTVNGCSSTSAVKTVLVNPTPSTPTIIASGNTTLCEGGSVTLTSDVDSGIQWSNNATSSSITVNSSGTYFVTSTLNSCTANSNSIAVTVNTTPTILLGVVNDVSSCGGADGSIQILGSGNGAVSWSGTTSGSMNGILPALIQNLDPGSYDITFSDGCVSNAVSATINGPTLPTAPTISVQGATTFCEGESVILSSSQSSGNVWSSGVTGQSITVTQSGTYTSTVSSAPGCDATSNSITITVNPTPPTPSITANGNTSFCEGESVTLTSDATNSVWSTGATTTSINVTTDGSFFVTNTVNGCSSVSDVVSTQVNPTPTPSLASYADICDTADVLTLNQGSPTGGTYEVDGTAATAFDPTVFGVGSFDITYTLTQNGCSGDASNTITVINCSGSGIKELNNGIKLFPNPTNGKIELLGITESELTQIQLFDAQGKLIQTFKTTQLDLSPYANGLYQLKISAKDFESVQKVQLIK